MTRLLCENGESLGVWVLKMKQWFLVAHLEVERLLSEWRWLCPHRMALVARTAFGDLFLRNEAGVVFWLNTAVGKVTEVAHSETQFLEMAETRVKSEESGLPNQSCRHLQDAA
jgi:hypothetical protein